MAATAASHAPRPRFAKLETAPGARSNAATVWSDADEVGAPGAERFAGRRRKPVRSLSAGRARAVQVIPVKAIPGECVPLRVVFT